MRACLATLYLCLLCACAFARDDGRYANDPLHDWFDRLASNKGPCCSFADGFRIDDVDWDSVCEPRSGRGEDSDDCRYRVRIHGDWIAVPPEALVTEPNRFGPAVVWPYQDIDGNTQIRCFLPGAGA